MFEHHPVEIIFAYDKNVAFSCRVYSCGSWFRIKKTIYTKVVTCGQLTNSENFRLVIVKKNSKLG